MEYLNYVILASISLVTGIIIGAVWVEMFKKRGLNQDVDIELARQRADKEAIEYIFGILTKTPGSLLNEYRYTCCQIAKLESIKARTPVADPEVERRR